MSITARDILLKMNPASRNTSKYEQAYVEKKILEVEPDKKPRTDTKLDYETLLQQFRLKILSGILDFSYKTIMGDILFAHEIITLTNFNQTPNQTPVKSLECRNFCFNADSTDAKVLKLFLLENRVIKTLKIIRASGYNNHLNSNSLGILSTALKNGTLKELHLCHHGLGTKSLNIIVEILKENKSLVFLNLSGNSFRHNGAYLLAKTLALHNSTLKKIALDDNGINIYETINSFHPDETAIELLLKNPNITHLSLKENNFDSPTYELIASKLAYNRQLRVLYLDECTPLIQAYLQRNQKKHTQQWALVSAQRAFFDANREHPLKNSIRPFLPLFLEMAGLSAKKSSVEPTLQVIDKPNCCCIS